MVSIRKGMCFIMTEISYTLSSETKKLFQEIMNEIHGKVIFLSPYDEHFLAYFERHNVNNEIISCVFLSKELDINQFEHSLLHELYHIYQVEKGFLRLNPKTIIAQNRLLGSSLSSLILDENINIWMRKNNIHYPYTLKDAYDYNCNLNHLNNSFHKPAFLGVCCVFYLHYKHDITEMLYQLIKKVNPTFYDDICYLFSLLDRSDFTSQVSCNSIFKELSSRFNDFVVGEHIPEEDRFDNILCASSYSYRFNIA